MPKNTNTALPWERQSGESEQAFEAFSLYRDKGLSRTLRAVADELHKSYTLIRRWNDKWNWEERVREYDNDLEKKAKREAEKGLRDMYTRHTKIAMTVQSKALQALEKLDPEDMTLKEIREYIKIGTDLERLNRTLGAGKAEEQAAASTESLADTILAAYTKRKGGG